MINLYSVTKKGVQYVVTTPRGVVISWHGPDEESALDDAFLRNMARALRIERLPKKPDHCGPDDGA